jgi:PPM family protein phosphatase
LTKFDAYSDSNSVGAYHEENQDSYLVDQQNLLVAVADGVGGYDGAKEASTLAIEMLKSDSAILVDTEGFRKSILEIHEKILDEAKRRHFRNMGTTIAAARIFPKNSGGKVICANAGDSPILLFFGRSAKAMYHDDSMRGNNPGDMSAIVQYLGADADLDVHVKEAEYNEKDILLLCSDGITDNLVKTAGKYDELAALASQESSARPIVESAMRDGRKRDDMTVIVVNL